MLLLILSASPIVEFGDVYLFPMATVVVIAPGQPHKLQFDLSSAEFKQCLSWGCASVEHPVMAGLPLDRLQDAIALVVEGWDPGARRRRVPGAWAASIAVQEHAAHQQEVERLTQSILTRRHPHRQRWANNKCDAETMTCGTQFW